MSNTNFRKFIIDNKSQFIVGIIIVVISPLINIIGSSIGQRIITTLINWSNGFARHYYLNVARNEEFLVSSISSTIISIIPVLVISIAYYTISVNLNLKRADITEALLNYELSDEEKLKIKLKPKKPETKENLIGDYKLSGLKQTIMFYVLVLYFMQVLIVGGITIYYNSIYRINNKFRNDLTILSLKLDDKQINSLRVQWLLIKSKDDFIKVRCKVDTLLNFNHSEVSGIISDSIK